ncbi:hypothetical protein UJ101_00474 [Flavobacteriaceae bacterium UJ101]|nr:hypothetical protein UJ101_00474 [Flavobacteriaceae bacterium UJ101]
MRTEIKILHSSCCGKGSPIKEQIENVAKEKGIDFTLEELTEMQDTMVYGTTVFPSIVVNDKVYPYKNYNTNEKLASILS